MSALAPLHVRELPIRRGDERPRQRTLHLVMSSQRPAPQRRVRKQTPSRFASADPRPSSRRFLIRKKPLFHLTCPLLCRTELNQQLLLLRLRSGQSLYVVDELNRRLQAIARVIRNVTHGSWSGRRSAPRAPGERTKGGSSRVCTGAGSSVFRHTIYA